MKIIKVSENTVNINSTKININEIDLISTLDSKFLFVDVLSEDLDPNIFYFIPESD